MIHTAIQFCWIKKCDINTMSLSAINIMLNSVQVYCQPTKREKKSENIQIDEKFNNAWLFKRGIIFICARVCVLELCWFFLLNFIKYLTVNNGRGDLLKCQNLYKMYNTCICIHVAASNIYEMYIFIVG